MERQFSLAKMGGFHRFLTWVYIANAAGALVLSVLAPGQRMLWCVSGLAWTAMVLYSLGWMRPWSIGVGTGGLNIVWLWRRLFIPRREILAVRRVSPGEIGLLQWGGTPFGSFGLRGSRSLGAMHFLASRAHGLVLIELRNRSRIILTPDSPDEFTAEMEKVLEWNT